MLTVLRTAALVTLCVLADRTQALDLYYYDGTTLATLPDPPPAVAAERRPVLFVHGHRADFGGDSDSNTDPNYQVNFIRRLDIGAGASLPSFDLAIQRNPNLNIEPYYIRFVDQARSISEDANDISLAVDLIVRRHNPGFDVTNPSAPPDVQVSIIGYSKGTISSRQYLQRLQGAVAYPDNVTPISPARPDYRPVSEFIAISPPNHGISLSWLRFLPTSLSIKQLHNGRKGDGASGCGEDYGSTEANNFMEILNGDSNLDFTVPNTQFIATEAPGARCVGKLPSAGPLYVAIYAASNADAIGGQTPSGDCLGREMARNLAEDAVNIQVANISGGNDKIAVHQRTVHTPEVICKALYTAVHHRPPPSSPAQTCTLDADDVPIIPPPQGAATAMLTLDLSGSMLAPGCTGCTSRLEMLRDAVTLFLETWWSIRPNDRVGVTYFRTGITEPSFNNSRMPTLDSSRALIVQDLTDTGPMPGNNLTAMGAGLRASIAELQSMPPHLAARPQVILFSDGMQNVNPLVQPIPGEPGFEIANQTGPPTKLNQCTGFPVNTIAVGTGQPFLDQLQQIAGATGGQSGAIDDASGLRQMFIDQLIGTLSTSSPQLVSYRRGVLQAQTATEQFSANSTARKVVLSVSWQRGQTLDVTAIKNGADVTPSARVASGEFYRILTFDAPGPAGGVDGQWEIRISGQLGTPYEASAIVDEAALSYRAQLGSPRNLVGLPLELSVQVFGEKRPVDGQVTVTAALERPRIAIGNLLEQIPPPVINQAGVERRLTVSEQKLAALIGDAGILKQARAPLETVRLVRDGKGTFRATLPNTTVPGLYRVTFRIVGDGGKFGEYERQGTVSAILRFAEAELLKTHVTARTVKNGVTEVTLRPRDKYDNLLGPGLAPEVQLAVSSGRVAPRAEDMGDGSYRFRVRMAKSGNPTLMLVIAERLLFKGTLTQLRRAARK